jgi:hypothetical protein
VLDPTTVNSDSVEDLPGIELTHRRFDPEAASNTYGIHAGDKVRILGVPVGKIDRIEPQPQRVKLTLWFDDKYTRQAGANAAIPSPSLVAVRNAGPGPLDDPCG